ncbi:MAG: hypothetical protein ACFFEE_07320 [Candidatus Thorarchaeota archaeon]
MKRKDTPPDDENPFSADLPSKFLYRCSKCGFEEKFEVPKSPHEDAGGLFGNVAKEIQYVPDGITCSKCGDHKTVMLVPCVMCLKDYTVNTFDDVSKLETRRIQPCPTCMGGSKVRTEKKGTGRGWLRGRKSRETSQTGEKTHFQYYCTSCKKKGLHPVSHVLRPLTLVPRAQRRGEMVMYMHTGAPPFQIRCENCRAIIHGALEKCLKCDDDWIFANLSGDFILTLNVTPQKCPSCGGKWQRRHL